MSIEGSTRQYLSKGIVVVAIQYRLGFLGFFDLKKNLIHILGFFTTFTDDFPPNLGLLDQVRAVDKHTWAEGAKIYYLRGGRGLVFEKIKKGSKIFFRPWRKFFGHPYFFTKKFFSAILRAEWYYLFLLVRV